jgi:hypothetical protein
MEKKGSSLNTLQSSSTMNSLLFLLFILKFPQILTLLYLKSLMSKYLFIFLSLSLTANTLILPCDAICTRYGIHQLSQSRRNVSNYLTMNGQQTELNIKAEQFVYFLPILEVQVQITVSIQPILNEGFPCFIQRLQRNVGRVPYFTPRPGLLL